MKVVLLLAVALAGCAAPSSSPEISGTMSGAPSVRGALDPGDGNQTGLSSEDPVLKASMTGGAPTPRPTAYTIKPATGTNPDLTPPPEPVVSAAVRGTATYYCRPGISRCTRGYPDGMYAAAGPDLRKLLGPDWRGSEVIVTDALGNVAVVRIVDFCQCSGDHVIDLYWLAFQGIVNPVRVTVP